MYHYDSSLPCQWSNHLFASSPNHRATWQPFALALKLQLASRWPGMAS